MRHNMCVRLSGIALKMSCERRSIRNHRLCCVGRVAVAALHGSHGRWPARGLAVSASASGLVGREFESSRPGLTKTLQTGTVTFLPGARCVEELEGTHPEHENKPSETKADIVHH